jgi:hypothetical protein
MKRQKSCGPRLGKLVHQLPGVVTFAYDLRFRCVIARWKGIVEEIHFGGSIMPLDIIEHLDLKKPSFRPSKWPRKLNLLKIVNCQNCQKTILSQSEKVGGHRYPLGSKVQINLDIPIFEGQIDTDVVDKWLNLLEGYFSVHNFSNRENITFALLKVVPRVKYWWETFCEQKETE